MELKLNIYSSTERDKNGKRTIEKTYKVDSYELLYGTVEDVLNLFDVESLKTDEDVLRIVKSAKNQVNDLLKDIFIGIADDELRRANFDEMALVIVSVLKSSINEIIGKVKNVMRV